MYQVKVSEFNDDHEVVWRVVGEYDDHKEANAHALEVHGCVVLSVGTQPTVEARYARRFAEMQRSIESLRIAVDEHARAQKSQPESWGWNGSLGHAEKLVREAIRALAF